MLRSSRCCRSIESIGQGHSPAQVAQINAAQLFDSGLGAQVLPAGWTKPLSFLQLGSKVNPRCWWIPVWVSALFPLNAAGEGLSDLAFQFPGQPVAHALQVSEFALTLKPGFWKSGHTKNQATTNTMFIMFNHPLHHKHCNFLPFHLRDNFADKSIFHPHSRFIHTYYCKCFVDNHHIFSWFHSNKMGMGQHL